MRILITMMGVLLAGPGIALDDNDAVALSVFDFIDGWYEGDGVKLEQSLHPELALRTLNHGKDGNRLSQMSALSLIYSTIAGDGARATAENRVKEVIILDTGPDIASVKTLLYNRTAYLHLAKINQRWVIVNILWQPARSD